MSGTIGDARKRRDTLQARWGPGPMNETCETVDSAALMRQALWNVYEDLGCDTDGDDHYHGSDADLVRLVVRAAREHQVEADSEYDALHVVASRLARLVPPAYHREIQVECRFHGIPL